MVTRRRLTQAARWVAALVILTVAGAAEAGADGFGPFPARNFQPFQLLFLGMFGDRAEVVGKGAFDVRVELADITLISKYQFLDQSAQVPAVALRFAVKVPSGDSGKVFGSGHADVGLGLAVEKSLATRWILYGNVNGIFPTGPVDGLTVQPAVSALTAAEYLWSPTVSFVAQF